MFFTLTVLPLIHSFISLNLPIWLMFIQKVPVGNSLPSRVYSLWTWIHLSGHWMVSLFPSPSIFPTFWHLIACWPSLPVFPGAISHLVNTEVNSQLFFLFMSPRCLAFTFKLGNADFPVTYTRTESLSSFPKPHFPSMTRCPCFFHATHIWLFLFIPWAKSLQ